MSFVFFGPTIRSLIGDFGFEFDFQGFNWISVFEVKFDFKRWTPKRISYEVRNNNRWPVNFFCKNYDMAEGPTDKNLIYIKYSEVSKFSTNIFPSSTVENEKKKSRM